MMDSGNVQRMVQQLQVAAPGDTGRDRGRSSGLPHGSAEQGSDPRAAPRGRGRSVRSRDRDRDPREVRPSTPNSPARGQIYPATMQEFDDRFTRVDDRIDAIERMLRLHAQSIAMGDEAVTNAHRKIVAIDNDFVAYKNFITGVHTTIDNYVAKQFTGTHNVTDGLAQVMTG